MIKVSNLTKKYGRHLAVDDVSFEVRRGEIVGFLGPNGAGKTTTMRILTGYLPATGGTVLIGGTDVFKNSMDVRRRIGYLPENCPLYPELRVDEYLRFRADLKGVPRRMVRKRIADVKELCGLTSVGKRIIGQLSKGYRQRVGLAESLIHEPELLILDEPTIGLDPNQIRSVRSLIRGLAERHTILLSTHILSEVEIICDRVLIINEGKIVASDTPDALAARTRASSRVLAEIQGPEEVITSALQGLPGVQNVFSEKRGEWIHWTIESATNTDLRPDVYALAVKHSWPLRELTQDKPALEDIFVALTSGQDGGIS